MLCVTCELYIFSFLMMVSQLFGASVSQKKHNRQVPDTSSIRQRPVHSSLVFTSRRVESARCLEIFPGPLPHESEDEPMEGEDASSSEWRSVRCGVVPFSVFLICSSDWSFRPHCFARLASCRVTRARKHVHAVSWRFFSSL